MNRYFGPCYWDCQWKETMTAFPFWRRWWWTEKTRCISRQVSEQLSNGLLGEEMGWERSSQAPFAEVYSTLGLPVTDLSFARHLFDASDVFCEQPSSSWPGPEHGALQQQGNVCELLAVTCSAPGPLAVPGFRRRRRGWVTVPCLQAGVFLFLPPCVA